LDDIYQNDHIPAIDYAYHGLLEAPLDLEALGLRLFSLLVNPALGVAPSAPCECVAKAQTVDYVVFQSH